MLKISILVVYVLSQDNGILGISKFSLYKKRTEQKKNPTTEAPYDYTGPPFLDVNWNGHSNLPEEVNNAEILKEILEKVARYKRYEYCPFGKLEKCEKKAVNEIVDEIIDVVLHPTEPPTEPPTQPPVTSRASEQEDDGNVAGLDEEVENESEETDGPEGPEGTEGEGKAVDTTEEAGEGEETSTGEDASEGDATEAPAEEPEKEDS